VNLHDLHTPVPLTEDDYASIRASVHAELSARRRRRQFALALATAATLAFALWLQTPKPAHIPPPEPRNTQWSARVLTRDVPSSPQPAPAITPALHRAPTQLHKEPHRKAVQPDPIRIELHTHDPDIRIIWIVSPDKEES